MTTSDDEKRTYAYRTTLPSFVEALSILGHPPVHSDREAEIFAEDAIHGPIHVLLHAAWGPPCTMCGDISDALCDFPVGDEGRTCDRAICSRCAPMIGADKNYCAEHAERGPGMLLFVPAPRTPEPPQRTRRLPNKPPIDRRWCVMDEDGSVSGWMDQVTAKRIARSFGRTVLSWEKFVMLWRQLYPLKKRPRKP